MRPSDIGTLLALATIWGAAFPLTRIAAPAFGPVPLILIRVAFGAVAMLPLMSLRGTAKGRVPSLVLMGVLSAGIPLVLYAYALLTISSGLGALLNATTPMWGALIGAIWLRERLTVQQLLGIAIGFVGVSTLVWDSVRFVGAAALLGAAAALAASCFYAVGAAYAKAKLADLDPRMLSTGSLWGAGAFTLPLAVWQTPDRMPGLDAWICAAILGVVCSALGWVLYYRLLRRVGVARSTAVTFLLPISGILWGAALLHERITLAFVGSCVLVLIGTGLAIFRREPQ